MIRGYYDVRQWTELGFVPHSKVDSLRLGEVTPPACTQGTDKAFIAG